MSHDPIILPPGIKEVWPLFSKKKIKRYTVGVYVIFSVFGHVYVGSSCCIQTRIHHHVGRLRRKDSKNDRANPSLKRLYLEHGEDCLFIAILERPAKEDLVAHEDKWLQHYKANGLTVLNSAPTAFSAAGFRHTKETRQAQSERQKGKPGNPLQLAAMREANLRREYKKGYKLSEETRARMSKAFTGRKLRSYIVPTRRRRCRFLSPQGEVVEVFGLAEFCKKNGLNNGAMSRLANGHPKVKSCKGWKRYVEQE